MMTKTIEKFQKMIDMLYTEGSMSPAKIAKRLQADVRTIRPMILVAERLGLITCKKLTLSNKTYSEIDLTSGYRRLLEQSKKSGGKNDILPSN